MPPDDTEFELESCRACRGEGTVISNLGGESREVTCPWCEGTGRFIPEHDAQARWLEKEEGDEGAAQAQE
jgi:DnaJ-class molecular chaperone